MPREKKYYEFDQPIKEVPAETLRATLGNAANSEIIRTIALNEAQYLTAEEDRSLRAFWYATVKPVLNKLDRLSFVTEEKMTAWDQELSRHLASLVKDGILTYEDLRIVDTSRSRSMASALFSCDSMGTYGYKVSSGEFPNVILCTEKDTAVGILRAVATITGCSWLSGGGQNALSAMEPILRAIPENYRRHIMFLSITDHDPAGYSIADTFKNQASYFQDTLGIYNIHADRLGIFPRQLTQTEIEANVFKPKGSPKALDEWIASGGGINGEALGLELDAYSSARLRRVLIEGLQTYGIQPSAEYVKESYIRKQALEAIQPHIESVLSNIVEHERDNVQVYDFDVMELAEQGHDTLPIESMCNPDRDDEIERLALSAIGTEPE